MTPLHVLHRHLSLSVHYLVAVSYVLKVINDIIHSVVKARCFPHLRQGGHDHLLIYTDLILLKLDDPLEHPLHV